MSICVVGSANADLITMVDRRPAAGETLLGSDLTVLPGGKGANQAAAAGNLFEGVSFIGAVGEDGNGQMLLRSLAQARVDTNEVAVLAAATGCALIVVTADGENSIIVAPGANRQVTPEFLAGCSAWQAANTVVCQLEIPLETVEYLAAECRKAGIRFVLNAAPIQVLPGEVLRACDPLVVNESEAEFLVGGRIDTVEAAVAAAQQLVAVGPKSVVITLGGRGAVGVAADGSVIRQPAQAVSVVDTTGAGDAFVGVLAARLAEGGSLADGMAAGTVVAAHAIGRRGAQSSYPTKSEVKLP